MSMYAKVRRMRYRDGLAISEIARRTSLSRNTVKIWLREPARDAMNYRRPTGPRKLDAHAEWLRQALETDGTPVSSTPLWPTPSSIGSSTTVSDSLSPESPCASKKPNTVTPLSAKLDPGTPRRNSIHYRFTTRAVILRIGDRHDWNTHWAYYPYPVAAGVLEIDEGLEC